MRKSINIFLIALTLITVLLTSSCSSTKKLLLLNWGEYINMDLVSEFEDKYDCEVVISLADSNDLFYSKVKSGTTVYDLVVPSDYMVSKMHSKGLLQPIDYHKLGFNSFEEYQNIFLPGVKGIINEMEKQTTNIKNYFVPYFWGTWGIMYNKTNQELAKVLTEADDIWQVFFEDNLLPSGTKTGMYDTSRYAYAAAMFYANKSPNEQSDEALNLAEEILSNKRFTSWATDTLKKDIARGNLDLGFMWTGDFLDMLYQELKATTLDNVGFDIIIPEKTIAFCDSFVITKNARNVDLAHKFIKFFLDENIAYRNASIVGYCTPIAKTYDMITKYNNQITINDLKQSSLSNIQVNPLENGNYVIEGICNNQGFILEATLNEINQLGLTIEANILDIDPKWLANWSYAVNKYYPKDIDNEKGFNGVILNNLPREYIDQINTLCNNAKTK